MSVLSRLIGRRADPVTPRVEPQVVASAPTSGTKNPSPDVFGIGFGPQSRVASLPHASPLVAQRHATVFACCNNIAGDTAKVPLHVMQRDKEGNEKRVFNHPAEHLMNVESAPGVPAFVTRFNLAYALTLRGRGHAYVPRDGGGEVELIEFVSPDLCTMLRSGRERYFQFQDGADIHRRVPSSSMVTLRYMALDGWTGRSPIEVAGESMGLALAGQEAAARTAAGGHIRGAVKLEGAYETDEDHLRNAQRVRNSILDPEKHGFPILGIDEDIINLNLSAADLELLASRKFDREQIAALYRMPPSKLQMLEYGVKANGQQQALDYRSDCLLHWVTPLEAEYGLGIFTAAERAAGLVFRHDFSALLTPTTQELYTALQKAVGGPFMTANTAQRRAGLPVTDGPDDDRLNPASNMTRAEPGEANEIDAEEEEG